MTPGGLFRQDSDRLLWGVIEAPPLKTRFWEACINAPLVFADFWKKVLVFPPADGLARGKSALFSQNRRIRGVDFCYLTEKLVKKGVTPILGTLWRF